MLMMLECSCCWDVCGCIGNGSPADAHDAGIPGAVAQMGQQIHDAAMPGDALEGASQLMLMVLACLWLYRKSQHS